MKKFNLLLVAAAMFALIAVPDAFSKGKKPQKKDIGLEYIDSNFSTYDGIQKKIHSFAEVGYKEVQSSKLLAKHLEDNGFTIEWGVADIPTAFVATYGNEGPAIGFLAEYDALPGMSQDTVPYRKPLVEGAAGHGCGHNLLGTGAVAAAIATSKWIADGHKGIVKLFGCPAEEGGGAKAYMARDHVFDGVDCAFDWHPATVNSITMDTGLANVHVKFRFKGVSAHASMAPEQGRSALDAAEAFNFMMNLMREHVPMTTRIHYIYSDGGQAPNVVPETAECEYYIRSPKQSIVWDVFDRAIKAAEGAAMGTGTTMTYEMVSGNYERLLNRKLAEIMQKHLDEVGGVTYDERERKFAEDILEASGVTDKESVIRTAASVRPLADEKETLTGASSDVGNVAWVCPVGGLVTATFVYGPGHCWQQVAAGGMTIGTKGMLVASKVMYLSACELLSNPDELQAVKDEFESRRGADFVFKPMMGDRKPPLDYRDSL